MKIKMWICFLVVCGSAVFTIMAYGTVQWLKKPPTKAELRPLPASVQTQATDPKLVELVNALYETSKVNAEAIADLRKELQELRSKAKATPTEVRVRVIGDSRPKAPPGYTYIEDAHGGRYLVPNAGR